MPEEPSALAAVLSLISVVIILITIIVCVVFSAGEWWRKKGRRPDNSWAYKDNYAGTFQVSFEHYSSWRAKKVRDRIRTKVYGFLRRFVQKIKYALFS